MMATIAWFRPLADAQAPYFDALWSDASSRLL
jgi:hypothetical protein